MKKIRGVVEGEIVPSADAVSRLSGVVPPFNGTPNASQHAARSQNHEAKGVNATCEITRGRLRGDRIGVAEGRPGRV